MKVGASYYPELSSRAMWEQDLATAREVGLTVLRCGEFAWSRISPQPGDWRNEWIREFLDLAGERGFSVIWCTPSATPPPYLFDRWPDLVAVDEKQRPVPLGLRRNYCPSHAEYRELCRAVARRLVESLDAHPAVAGWQVDNELAGDGFTCWCPQCERQFQSWLAERYGSLENLAEAWQADVWAQRYTSWSQIPIPQRAFPSHTPALKLAWRRFRSENWLGFYRNQADAMKEAGARKPITTNFYNLLWDVPFDRWRFRPHMDAIGISHYVEDEVGSSFELALLRGLDNKPLWVLEQKAGQQNAQNLYPEDLGRIARHLDHCAEAGTEYALYWHLRQHAAGCEMEHGAVLRHDGKPTRVARAIQTAITQPHRRRAISRKRVLVFDFAQHWAQENRPQPGTSWDYRRTLEHDWYGALRQLWDDVAVGNYEDALAMSDVVFAPHFQMADRPELAETFLARGGTLVTTADFGRLDLENNVRRQPPLGGLPADAPKPNGEMLHLREDFAVKGSLLGTPLLGRNFWFVPDEPCGETHFIHEGQAGPAFLNQNCGGGRLVVMLSAFDQASLHHLLKTVLA